MNQDLSNFVETARALKFFDRGASLIISRAPGRLDVMGGIADYSGSLVLQRPIAEATFAALQVTDQPVFEVQSVGRKVFALNHSALAPGGEPITYKQARTLFTRNEEDHWAAYVIGVFLVLMRECGVSFSQGSKILISSSVPEGKGVASSAALEVSTMQAAASAFDVKLEPHKMALLCQTVENRVAGASCGVMDQMTSVCGEADCLLALLCQPAELQPPVHVPEGIALWGVDSGERHAVTGSDYGSVRTGAFMGLRMISEMGGHGWNGYLANVSPSEFEHDFLRRLPDQMSGEEFISRYSGITDTVTEVEPARTYKIRQPTAHPVYEHDRVKAFRQLLRAPPSEEQRTRLGELMYQSHESYSACGLGSRGTDLIVNLVRSEGQALYGARITGGGSGGTVAILGRADAEPAIKKVVESYQTITGRHSYVFSGSSSGAAKFGSMSLTP